MLTAPAQDPLICQLIAQELHRQQTDLNLIASENYVDPLVLAVTGSVLTNKYAEGYPGKRYYGGCQVIDQIEELAIQRAQQLFQAPYVNVQPHSGSSANLAAYFSVLKPGDKILGMRLSEGGHLTHGHSVSFSGQFYQSLSYGVDPETEQIDYAALAELIAQHRPQLLVCGASAYSRILDFAKLAEIAHAHQALLLADIAHIAGLVATGLHPSPLGHADIITSTTHKTLRGPRGGLIMARAELGEQLNKAVMPGTQGGPLEHVIAAKAVAFGLALQPAFKAYQQQVLTNAQVMAKTLAELGYRIVSGGTDNHLFLVDLRSQNLTGLAAEKALSAAGITVNRNCIPGDTAKPWITSGIRIGTPAMTTRGMREQEAQEVAYLIHEALQNHSDLQKLATIKSRILTLCTLFGLPYTAHINHHSATAQPC